MSTSDPLGTLPMFEVPASPAVFKPKATAEPGAPRWSKYRPKNPVKCDHCLRVLAERNGNGPASHPAKFKRTVGDTFLLLCYQHAEAQRTEDGLPKLKEAQ
jgi:hypothetical protein